MPIRMRVDIPRNLPTNLAERIAKEIPQAMRQSQVAVVNEARTRAPVRTGALRRSITAEDPKIEGTTITGAVGAGGAGAPYAKGVEYGTGVYSTAPDSSHSPIMIRPIHAKALAWPNAAMGAPGGQFRRLSGGLRTGVLRQLQSGKLAPNQVFVFAKKVVQQGQRPRPFLRPGLEAAEPTITRIFGRIIDRALGG